MSDEVLGSGGRLRGAPAHVLVEAAHAHEIRHAPALADALSAADLAHAVCLVESGVLDRARGAALIRGLLELESIPPEAFPWRADLGDAFNSREALLTERVGRDAAGWLSAGRPRREAFRVALRLVARTGANRLIDDVAAFVLAVATLARRHADDLAADFTYLQAAQPTTIGHVLAAYGEPAVRDLRRLAAVEAELARSVAGAGGSAGSRWPLDRERLAELLGCDGLVPHTRDAAWGADVYVELLSAVATALASLSQLGQDFEIYASAEFGLVELPDDLSRASALMPQKKNPYALAAIRTQAAIAAGDVSAALVALHTGTARTDHFHLLNGSVPRALAEASAVARLATEVCAGLRIDRDTFARAACAGFTIAADLADALAVELGVDHRTAHKVVGRAVRTVLERGGDGTDLDEAAVMTAHAEITGSALVAAPPGLGAALDPLAVARGRSQTGSSGAGEVARLIDGLAVAAEAAMVAAAARSARMQAARDALGVVARSVT